MTSRASAEVGTPAWAARLSYLMQCHEVRDHWRDESTSAFFLLTPAEQWALFAYFAPIEKLTDDELIMHREDISFIDPSLPQRAGRALSKLWAASKRLEVYRQAAHPNTRKKGADYQVRIMSQVRPDLDAARFARILMDIAREKPDQDKAA